MRIGIVGNHNGIGLQRDAELLTAFLSDHEVTAIQFDQPPPALKFDLLIFLEVISEMLMQLAPRSWIFVNPEWAKPEYVRAIQKCEKIFAKTREAEKILREKFSNVHYVGFLTADKITAAYRERQCLHIGGNSGMRGTNSVIEAWRSYRYWDETPLPPLTVVSNSRETVPFEDTPGITFVKRATNDQITELQNSHLFHLYPSATEGFGHALHEAQSVGAVILATQAPPMNEIKAPFEVKPCGTKKVNMGTLYEVSPQDIREKVSGMLAQPSHEIARMRVEARLRFEKGNAEFRKLFAPHLADGHSVQGKPATRGIASASTETSIGKPLRIAFLGNFVPAHSTENDLLWTLRDMGHEVITFQENEAIPFDVAEGSHGADVFVWVHTHNWGDPMALWDMLAKLKEQSIPTAGFHLDRYWGLNKLDRREDLIGKNPWWGCQYLFTADGGNQDRFRERLGDDRHHWLPPAVVKRDCYLGATREELRVDVGFVGAEGYHPEYSFRGEMIHFLRAVYGDRFRVFNGYRGRDLNDLYASISVCVGDSCFAGSDFYWSDRIPESLGRGAFLLHPACKGLTIPGLVTFEPGNLQELQDKIDYYLAHERERLCLREAAYNWIEQHETYSNRMEILLRTVGLG